MSDRSIIEPPAWALSLVGRTITAPGPWTDEGGLRIRESSGPAATLVSVVQPDAVDLDANAFRATTASIYERIYAACGTVGLPPVRMWNVIPNIVAPLDDLPHRYMAFNAGRHEAFRRHYGGGDALATGAPTASGVGSFGRDLVIHALGMAEATRPFENPRQTPARCYSDRYGPNPPCFARASRIERSPEPWLFMGGTASVVGEDSCHVDDLEAQFDETVRNMRALLEEAGTAATAPKSIRVYFTRAGDEATIRERIPTTLGSPDELEMIHAELCRPELLVEIEGVYAYPATHETTAAI